MHIGKLSVTDLKNLVLKNIKNNREDVISRPEIGGDCAIVKCGQDKLIYLSSDPITGATSSLGKLAVNINVNDIATGGIPPLGIMLTILAPEDTEGEEIENIVKEAQEECDKMNISILGGHTEITNAVNRIVVSVTAIGIGDSTANLENREILPGDNLIITKGIGIEGTGIIAAEKQKELTEKFGSEFVKDALLFLDQTSVVKEGLISGKYSKRMHDVTEGGILGAVWELADNCNLGVELQLEKEIIHPITEKICDYVAINPLKLISSGTMLICVKEENTEYLLSELEKAGIKSFQIGYFTDKKERTYRYNGVIEELHEPVSDELYKIF